jgi:hypothetical protein
LLGQTGALNVVLGDDIELAEAATVQAATTLTVTAAKTLTVDGALTVAGKVIFPDTALLDGTGTVTTTGSGSIVSHDGAVLEVLLPLAGTALAVTLAEDYDLTDDAEILVGTVLTVAAETTLKVPGAVDLTVSGTLSVDGTLTLALATSSVIIPGGGQLAVAATGKLLDKDNDVVGVVLSVTDDGGTDAGASVSSPAGAPTVFIVTAADSTSLAAATIGPVGNVKWTTTVNADATDIAGEADTGTAGTLRVGDATKVVLVGIDP